MHVAVYVHFLRELTFACHLQSVQALQVFLEARHAHAASAPLLCTSNATQPSLLASRRCAWPPLHTGLNEGNQHLQLQDPSAGSHFPMSRFGYLFMNLLSSPVKPVAWVFEMIDWVQAQSRIKLCYAELMLYTAVRCITLVPAMITWALVCLLLGAKNAVMPA